jgi:hypothetical protein
MLSKKNLSRDVDCIIVSYCGARSLCDLTLLHKKKKSDILDEDILEPVWKDLVLKRWRMKGNVLRAVGAFSWKIAYQILAFRHKIPRGIFTEKHNTIFGNSFSAGCESWVLVGHRSNTSLRRNVVTGDDIHNYENMIELRVCVQNVYNGLISIPLNNKNFEICCRSEEDQSLQHMIVNSVHNLGVNGLRKEVTASNDLDIKLKPFESAVISVGVCCPRDMEFETDFLGRADFLSMKIHICKPCEPFELKYSIALKMKFVDEDTVWESYCELPGRVILLRQDCGGDSMV